MTEKADNSGLEHVALPFVVQDRNGEQTLPKKSLALASLFSLVDSQRQKGGDFVFIAIVVCLVTVIIASTIAGFFLPYLFAGSVLGAVLLVAAFRLRTALRRQQDKVMYVSLVDWPFMLVRRQDLHKHAFFDTLDLVSSTFNYEVSHPVGDFLSEMEVNPSDIPVQSFIDQLNMYESAFKDFAEAMPRTIEGCVNDKRLMEYLISVCDLSTLEEHLGSAFALSPKVGLGTIENRLDALTSLKASARNDAAELSSAAGAASSAVSRWLHYLSERQDETALSYNADIEQIRPEVETRVADYQEQMEAEVHSVRVRTRPMISSLQAQVARWESEEAMYKRRGEAYHAEEASARSNKDKASDQLRRLERERQAEITKATDYYNQLVEQEWDRIRSLESERDARIEELENNKSEVSEKLRRIEEELLNLIYRKDDFIASIDETGLEISPELHYRYGDQPFPLHVPLCIVKFANKESRFSVISPLLLRKGRGALSTLKGLFGGFDLPLEPQSRMFEEEIAKSFREALVSDPDLQSEIEEGCPESDILREIGMKETISQGVIELRDLGWIRDKRSQALLASIRELYGVYESGTLWPRE